MGQFALLAQRILPLDFGDSGPKPSATSMQISTVSQEELLNTLARSIRPSIPVTNVTGDIRNLSEPDWLVALADPPIPLTWRVKELSQHPDLYALGRLAEELLGLRPGDYQRVVERKNSAAALEIIRLGFKEKAEQIRDCIVETFNQPEADKLSQQIALIQAFIRYTPLMLLMTASPSEISVWRNDAIASVPNDIQQEAVQLRIASSALDHGVTFGLHSRYAEVSKHYGELSNLARYSAYALKTFSRIFNLIYNRLEDNQVPDIYNVAAISHNFIALFKGLKQAEAKSESSPAPELHSTSVLQSIDAICTYCEAAGIRGKAVNSFVKIIHEFDLASFVTRLPSEFFKGHSNRIDEVLRALARTFCRSKDFLAEPDQMYRYLCLKDALKNSFDIPNTGELIDHLNDPDTRVSLLTPQKG